ncbi:hypothetical protein EBZ80_16190, partial [bacterium]|nr:hypothetical protein [bacterium]
PVTWPWVPLDGWEFAPDLSPDLFMTGLQEDSAAATTTEKMAAVAMARPRTVTRGDESGRIWGLSGIRQSVQFFSVFCAGV